MAQKYYSYKHTNAGKTCKNSPTEVQPPPNIFVATSAQRGYVSAEVAEISTLTARHGVVLTQTYPSENSINQ